MRKKQILQRLLAIKAELAKEGADVSALETEARSLKTELEGIEARENLFSGLENRDIPQPGNNANMEFDPKTVTATEEYRSAWAKVMLNRSNELNEIEKRAYSTADNSGAAVIPTALSEKIYEKMASVSPILGRISTSEVPGNMRIPREKSSALAAWHTENADIAPSQDALDYISLAGYELVKLVRVSIAAQSMSIPAFENYIINSLAKKLAIPCEAAIFNGTGSGQPKGIFSSITWNATNSLSFPKNGNPTYDHIMKLNALLPSGYHASACYVMNSNTFYNHIKTIKDNEGRPLFDTNSGKLDNKPIILSEQCVDKKIALGDFSNYHMNYSQPMRIDKSTESSFARAAVDYRGILVADGAPIMDEAFVMLSEAA